MAIPTYWVNGPRVLNPTSGIALCSLNPPFTQHQTLEILVHCATGGTELRRFGVELNIREIVMAANQDVVYLTVEPGEFLGLYWLAGVQAQAVQGSIYAWR